MHHTSIVDPSDPTGTHLEYDRNAPPTQDGRSSRPLPWGLVEGLGDGRL
ncbi:MAG: hypothetical protein ACE366_16685 [Bradymonadia bacterium]